MRRGLSISELDFIVESEVPHIQNPAEKEIFRGAVDSMQPNSDGTFPDSEIDKLFDASTENRGRYPEMNTLTGTMEEGKLRIGYELRSTVIGWMRALLKSDSTH